LTEAVALVICANRPAGHPTHRIARNSSPGTEAMRRSLSRTTWFMSFPRRIDVRTRHRQHSTRTEGALRRFCAYRHSRGFICPRHIGSTIAPAIIAPQPPKSSSFLLSGLGSFGAVRKLRRAEPRAGLAGVHGLVALRALVGLGRVRRRKPALTLPSGMQDPAAPPRECSARARCASSRESRIPGATKSDRDIRPGPAP
jgi:hypothetical protein